MTSSSNIKSSKPITLSALLEQAYPSKIPDELSELAQKVDSAVNPTDKDKLYTSLVSKTAEMGNIKLSESILAFEDYEKKDQGYFSLAQSYIMTGHFDEVRKITGVIKNIFFKDRIYQLAIEVLNINSRFTDAKAFAEGIKDNEKKLRALEDIRKAKEKGAKNKTEEEIANASGEISNQGSESKGVGPSAVISNARSNCKEHSDHLLSQELAEIFSKTIAPLTREVTHLSHLMQQRQTTYESKSSEDSGQVVQSNKMSLPSTHSLHASYEGQEFSDQILEIKTLFSNHRELPPDLQLEFARSMNDILLDALNVLVLRKNLQSPAISGVVQNARELDALIRNKAKELQKSSDSVSTEGNKSKENRPAHSGRYTYVSGEKSSTVSEIAGGSGKECLSKSLGGRFTYLSPVLPS